MKKGTQITSSKTNSIHEKDDQTDMRIKKMENFSPEKKYKVNQYARRKISLFENFLILLK